MNKMTVGSQAAVWGPNLLRPQVETSEQLEDIVHVRHGPPHACNAAGCTHSQPLGWRPPPPHLPWFPGVPQVVNLVATMIRHVDAIFDQPAPLGRD